MIVAEDRISESFACPPTCPPCFLAEVVSQTKVGRSECYSDWIANSSPATKLGGQVRREGSANLFEESRYCPRLQPWVGNRTKKCRTVLTVYRLGDLIPLAPSLTKRRGVRRQIRMRRKAL